MKKIIFTLGLMSVLACSKEQPIDVIAPQRDINTHELAKYKSHLENRNIVMGMMYNWANEAGAFLKNTPDSLDIVVVKDGYDQMNEIRIQDLSFVKEKKATRVLMGINFDALSKEYDKKSEIEIEELKAEKKQEWVLSGEKLTDQQKNKILAEIEILVWEKYSIQVVTFLEKYATTLLEEIKRKGFDGVSVELPQNFNKAYSVENIKAFLQSTSSFLGKEKEFILVVENPSVVMKEFVNKANWVVYRGKEKQLFANFDAQADLWQESKYLPSVDFSEEDLSEGYADTHVFVPSGRLPRTLDVLNWKATNKSGVAYYHIEKNYYELKGNMTSKTLRIVISKLNYN